MTDRLVDVAVVTGGEGSVQAALSSGTPFVGTPLHAEQDLNVHLGRSVRRGRRARPGR